MIEFEETIYFCFLGDVIKYTAVEMDETVLGKLWLRLMLWLAGKEKRLCCFVPNMLYLFENGEKN